MTEPNWAALPFRTDGSTWKAFVREPRPRPTSEAAGDAEPDGGTGDGRADKTEPPACGTVWIERDACLDFGSRVGMGVVESITIMGDGVLRWAAGAVAEGATLGERCFEVEFGGAPGVKYQVTCPGFEAGRPTVRPAGLRDLRRADARRAGGEVGGGSGGVFFLHMPVTHYHAREDAEAQTHGESVAQAMREFSLCKACSLILAMTDIGQEGLDGLSLQQIGELYRLAIGAFMDAFAAFNGQQPKSKGEEGKASAT